MSMDYWGIVGYGICLDDIAKYLNAEKVNAYVRNLLPNEEFEEDVLDDDTFCGDPYSNLAEFLCEFDEDNIFTWADDGQGTAYFLYEPTYPWKRSEKEPISELEAEDKMIKIIKRVYDINWNDLKGKFDYISTYGCG